MKKLKQPELKPVEELSDVEPVERLKVNNYGIIEGDFLEEDFDEEGTLGKDIDQLLAEEKVLAGDEIDKLFSEEKVNRHDDLEIEVRKALYRSESSKGSIQRGAKSAEAAQTTRKEEIASYKTLEDAWDGQIKEREKHGKSLLIIGVVCLTLAVVAGVWALLKIRQEDEITHKAELDRREQISQETQKKKEATIEDIRKVKSALIQYVNAKTTDEKIKLLYQPEKREQEIQAYYADPKNRETLDNIKVYRVAEEIVGEEKIWSIMFSHGLEGLKQKNLYFLRKVASGDYKIDWEALSGYQKFDWKKFVNERSTKPIEVRAVVVPRLEAGQYNWGFTDDEYFAYKLIVEENKIFWGYIHKENTAILKQMNQNVVRTIVQQKKHPQFKMQLILAINFKENTDAHNQQCVEILEIVSPCWVDSRNVKRQVEKMDNKPD